MCPSLLFDIIVKGVRRNERRAVPGLDVNEIQNVFSQIFWKYNQLRVIYMYLHNFHSASRLG